MFSEKCSRIRRVQETFDQLVKHHFSVVFIQLTLAQYPFARDIPTHRINDQAKNPNDG
jgi:hypothetical protein